MKTNGRDMLKAGPREPGKNWQGNTGASRAPTTEPPEVELLIGIAKQARYDLRDRDPSVRSDAAAFFTDGRLATISSLVGANPDYIERKINERGI